MARREREGEGGSGGERGLSGWGLRRGPGWDRAERRVVSQPLKSHWWACIRRTSRPGKAESKRRYRAGRQRRGDDIEGPARPGGETVGCSERRLLAFGAGCRPSPLPSPVGVGAQDRSTGRSTRSYVQGAYGFLFALFPPGPEDKQESLPRTPRLIGQKTRVGLPSS